MSVGEGQMPFYRPGERNVCPGCGGTTWSVGRHTATCGHPACSVVLPLRVSDVPRGIGTILRIDNSRLVADVLARKAATP